MDDRTMVKYTTSPLNTTPSAERLHLRSVFAREMVFAEFRPRDAWALDYGNFIDRRPGDMPRSAPEARFR